ncbi:MAG: pectin methylesterase [Clostridia bacterium]|nr:pectin methylesterase [Clostridia bacterium]
MPTGEKQDFHESGAGRMFDGGLPEYRRKEPGEGEKSMMITVAKDGSGDYTGIQAAVDSIPEYPGEEPVQILVRVGEYREKVVIHRDNVVLTGEDPEHTVVAWNGCAKDLYPDGTEKGTFLSSTLMVTGSHVTVENITIRNDAGDGRIAGQAVAVYAAGDRGIWKNCRMIAHQDTLFCGPVRLPNVREDIGSRTGSAEAVLRVEDGHLTHSRQYFENCLIRGDVDFIFGCYRCWFERCTLFMNERGGWYTAANTNEGQECGFVFHRCRLTGNCAPGAGFLGRPWRKYARTVFLECEMDEHVAPEGFSDWDEERVVTERCGEWRTTGARADQRTRHPAQKRLTDREAEAVLRSREQWTL